MTPSEKTASIVLIFCQNLLSVFIDLPRIFYCHSNLKALDLLQTDNLPIKYHVAANGFSIADFFLE